METTSVSCSNLLIAALISSPLGLSNPHPYQPPTNTPPLLQLLNCFQPTHIHMLFIFASQHHDKDLLDMYVYDIVSNTVPELLRNFGVSSRPDACFMQRVVGGSGDEGSVCVHLKYLLSFVAPIVYDKAELAKCEWLHLDM